MKIKIISAVTKKIPALLPHLSGRARWIAFAFGDAEKTAEQFESRLTSLVKALYGNTIAAPEFVDAMAALISRQITLAYREAWNDEGDGTAFPQYLTDSSEEMILGQYDFVDGFMRDIVNARIDGAGVDGVLSRVPLWANRYNEAYNEAVRLIQKENGGNLEWVYGDTDHCDTCHNLNGIVMSAKDWDTLGVKPQSAPNSKLECNGWRCQCELRPTTKRRSPGAYGRVEEIIR